MREKGTWTGRVIWEYMGMAMVRSVVVFLVFLTALAAIDSDWKLPSIHLGNGAPGYLQKTDKNTAEQLWCKKEILEISEEGPYLDFHSQVPSSENHSFIQSYYILLAKRSLWKAVSYLFFRDQQCILEENPGLHDLLNDDGSRTRFIKYKEFVSSLSSRVPRRSLRYKKHMRVTLESDPGHSPAPSPTSDSSGPSQEATASSNSPVSSSPSEPLTPPEESPEQKPNSESSSVPSDAQEEPKETAKEPKGTSEEPKGTSEEPKGTSKEPNETPKSSSASRKPKKAAASSSGKNEDNTVIMVAIVGCTLAAILIVVIFLICSLKEMDENEGPRDEKPLIKIASSDTSAENPGKTDSQTLPTANNLSVGTEVQSSSATNTMATEATGAAAPAKTHAALPLPPGKSAPLPSAAPSPSPSSNPSSNPSPSPSPPPPGPAAPPPPKPSGSKAPAPPPPRARPPPNPPKPGSGPKPSPPLPHQRGQTAGSEGTENGESPKAKLKPFFWDKVNASPNHSMVWHEIRGGSFQFNEEMMESLFGYAQPDQNKNDRKKDLSAKPSPQFIQIIEPKKAQNLAILLKALNVTTEEVCDALKEGNELPPELVQTLLKMAPTADEELKLRLYTGDISLLGPADRFLKILIEIPFAFKRMESLLFMSTLQEEIAYIKESFATLEVACNELKNSRLFLKLLEAVLKTGNRMNTGTYRGGAQAFKLDTLLKLSDVKGTDGKTTLLHFVVQEIIRSEGIRAARTLKESHSMSSVRTEDLAEDVPHESEEYHRTLGLQVVSSLGDELKDVKKAAVIEGDNLTQSVAKLGHSLLKSRDFLNKDMMSLEEDEFRVTLCSFVEHADGEIPTLLKDEQRIMALVKSTGDYFHGKSGKDEGLRLFAIVRDFLGMLDKVCKEVEKAANAKSQVKAPKKETTTATTTTTPSPSSSQESQTEPSPADMRQQLFPAITARKIDDDFSSDDESTSS